MGMLEHSRFDKSRMVGTYMTVTPRSTQELPTTARIIKILKAPQEQHEGRSTRATSRKRVGIVIPTLDEGRNLERLLPKIEDILAKHAIDGQLFIVDDNSRDGTVDIVMRIAMEYKNVTFIERPGKLGIGSAYRLGFKHALKAGMDVIFEMDADLSHRPSYIPAFMDCMENSNADLVIGSRYCDNGGTSGWSLKRRVISFIANAFTQLALGVNQTRDMTSGFRAYKAKTLKSIGYGSLVTNGYAWQIETLYKTRLRHHVIREIPIMFYERDIGKSKLGREDIMEFILYLCKALFSRAKHILQ